MKILICNLTNQRDNARAPRSGEVETERDAHEGRISYCGNNSQNLLGLFLPPHTEHNQKPAGGFTNHPLATTDGGESPLKLRVPTGN